MEKNISFLPYAKRRSGASFKRSRTSKFLPSKYSNFYDEKTDIDKTPPKCVYTYAEQKSEQQKTPMCRIAEIARFNKLRYQYILLDESGLAHKKIFTVKLVLSENQEYIGRGASIKKAQQEAAQIALKNTEYTSPQSGNRKGKKETSNPITLLHYVVSSRLNSTVKYYDDVVQIPVLM